MFPDSLKVTNITLCFQKNKDNLSYPKVMTKKLFSHFFFFNLDLLSKGIYFIPEAMIDA